MTNNFKKLYEQSIADASRKKICGQCGHSWDDRACGPTHGIVQGYRLKKKKHMKNV